MVEENGSTNRSGGSPRWWSSRTGIVLLGFIAVIGFLLAYEHQAHIFTGNWLLFALLGACIIMHLFMHGGHGGHGGGHKDGEK